MSETFHKAGIDTKSFDNLYPNRRCYPSLKHNPAHILAAQELANWIKKNEMDFGKVQIIKDDRRNALKDKQGILFILNGWSSTDHIDLWNGSELRGGYDNYLEHGTELWFWPLA